MQVNILEAKSQLSQLIKSAQAGEEVVIANRGEPVARLVPIGAPAGRLVQRSVTARVWAPQQPEGVAQWLDDHPLPAYLRRSGQEIDAAIQEERDAWE
jgi:prevent-host-death family protein